MSTLVKIHISDIAKDFDLPAKAVSEIVGRYFEKPKSAQQVLTEQQLNVLFDVMTQRNQVGSMEEIFATAKAAPKAAEPKAEEKKDKQK